MVNLFEMGNDQSHLSGIEIEEAKSIEVSDFWSHHSASIVSGDNVTNLSVFIGEVFIDGPLWKTQTPLEKTSKNLMIYRHPCILRYISSWHKSSKFYLATEEVVPLCHALAGQNSLQICIGLHSVLKALCFLHEKAQVSHNNVCTASIYVTKDGNWRLAGMEYLCKFTELTQDFLQKSRTNRYNKAIDPNEGKMDKSKNRGDFIDVFAYGVLVCEVLKTKNDDAEEIPTLVYFRDLCKTQLQNVNVAQRPKLSSLLDQEFFNHEFIIIHSTLIELPLKSDEEKTQFFHNLVQRLQAFPEDTVANQFGALLLSRMVLLNKTAQEELLPSVLCPKEHTDDGKLFSEATFKQFLIPKLLEIICVRDAQIRLLLLNHFKHFVHLFSKDELQTCILPELLVGVKDTNDELVSVTLRTLADLVPILGAATVIGGKRAKLFNDGRPIMHGGRRSRKNSKRQVELVELNPIVRTSEIILSLPERPRPDGEEVETTEEVETSIVDEEDLDNWEDWNEPHPVVNPEPVESSSINSNETVINHDNVHRKKSLPDIADLDIKNQTRSSEQNDEFDFFQDMEPVIEAASKFVIDNNSSVSSKLNAPQELNEDGWVDEEWD